VVRDVLSDKTLDQPALIAFGELFQSWITTNGTFKAWQMLGVLLQKRLREDPKRTLAQSYYVGAYKNPRCRLSMLIARLSRHWMSDPPDAHFDTAGKAMRAGKESGTGPSSLERILKGLESGKGTANKAADKRGK
jgi:hypothetical protein